MLAHLRNGTDVDVATLLIHPDNSPPIAIAQRHDFERVDDVEGRTFWRRPLTETASTVITTPDSVENVPIDATYRRIRSRRDVPCGGGRR